MRAVKSRDTAPERAVRAAVRELGYARRYRLNGAQLPGKPDLVFGALAQGRVRARLLLARPRLQTRRASAEGQRRLLAREDRAQSRARSRVAEGAARRRLVGAGDLGMRDARWRSALAQARRRFCASGAPPSPAGPRSRERAAEFGASATREDARSRPNSMRAAAIRAANGAAPINRTQAVGSRAATRPTGRRWSASARS